MLSPPISQSAICSAEHKFILSDKTDFRNYWKRRTMEQFRSLSARRNAHCLKLKEASSLMELLNKNSPHGFWLERLLAEKVLLTSGYAADLLKSKIGEDYIRVKESDPQIGTISVSDFKFTFSKPKVMNHNETEFFVLLLSNATEVKCSEIVRCVDGKVTFSEKFAFPVTKNFKIKVLLHSIVLKDSPKLFSMDKIFSCTNTRRNGFHKLQFKNLNTSDFEETKVMKSSLSLCAETEIKPSNFRHKTWKLKSMKHPFLNDSTTFKTNVEKFKIEFKKAGFLTFGSIRKGVLVWNRRWCSVNGQFLKIYGSPSEEDFSEALEILDMEKCPLSKIQEAPRSECNRPRSIIVEMFDNTTLTNYYFMADNNDDLKVWLETLNFILELVKFKYSYLWLD